MRSLTLVHFLLLFSLSSAANSAATANTQSFLSSAWSSSAVKLQERNLQEYADPAFSNPMDGIQLKLSQEEGKKEREGALRFEPRGWNEFGALRRLNKAQSRVEKMAHSEVLANALYERYASLVEYTVTLRRKNNLADFVKLHEKTLSMIRTSTRAASTDAKAFLQAKDDLEQAQFKLAAIENELSLLELKMKSLDPEFSKKQMTDLLNAEELANCFTKLQEKMPKAQDTFSVRVAQEKALIAQDEFQYDKSKSSRLFDYFEVKVSEEKNNEKTYAFEISINLPGFASSDYDIREKSRTLVENEIAAREAERLKPITLEAARLSLLRMLNVYKSTLATDKKSQDRIKRLAHKQDPILGISVEKNHLEQELRTLDVTQETFRTYLAFLTEANFLHDQPRTNFFSKDLQEIP